MPEAMMPLRTSRVEKRSSTTRYGTSNGLVLGIPRPVWSHHVPLQRNIRHVLLAKKNREKKILGPYRLLEEFFGITKTMYDEMFKTDNENVENWRQRT